jgi:hypothetical protein
VYRRTGIANGSFHYPLSLSVRARGITFASRYWLSAPPRWVRALLARVRSRFQYGAGDLSRAVTNGLLRLPVRSPGSSSSWAWTSSRLLHGFDDAIPEHPDRDAGIRRLLATRLGNPPLVGQQCELRIRTRREPPLFVAGAIRDYLWHNCRLQPAGQAAPALQGAQTAMRSSKTGRRRQQATSRSFSRGPPPHHRPRSVRDARRSTDQAWSSRGRS